MGSYFSALMKKFTDPKLALNKIKQPQPLLMLTIFSNCYTNVEKQFYYCMKTDELLAKLNRP